MIVKPFPETTTERTMALTVRSWRPSDAGAFRAVVTANMRHLDVFPWPSDSLDERVEQIRRNASRVTYSLGVFKADEIVGEVEANRNDDGSFTLFYWLAESATGKGYALAAVSAVVMVLFDLTDTEVLRASVERDNARSLKLLHALAFCRLGKDTLPSHDEYVLTRHAYTGGVLLPPKERPR